MATFKNEHDGKNFTFLRPNHLVNQKDIHVVTLYVLYTTENATNSELKINFMKNGL